MLAELKEELAFLKDQESTTSKENKSMSSQLNELRLQLERLDYDNKEGVIAMDILKEQNADLTNDIEELRKTLAELRAAQKEAASADDKEKKKAEKMALMMAKFDTVSVSLVSQMTRTQPLCHSAGRRFLGEGRAAPSNPCETG